MRIFSAQIFLAKYEWVLWVIMLVPMALIGWYWQEIPLIIPTHYDFSGKPDAWENKSILLWFVPCILFGLYVLLILIPILDPKKRIQDMGAKYFALKVIILALISGVLSVWIYSIVRETALFLALLFPLLALFLIALGVYLQTIKPNYFLGIRTPWTLSNEHNWQQTHRFGGRVYILGGLFLLIFSLWSNSTENAPWQFALLITILVLPFGYSFCLYVFSKQKT